MRSAIALLFWSFTMNLSALEWKSELFHCAANLPDSPGWQALEPPNTPGLTNLVVMQHLGRQAAFGINVVDRIPEASLAHPATRQTIENILRQFGYQFAGYSTVKVGGLDWLQYAVRSGSGAQQTSGLIRFASAGGYVYGITMLRGGGQEAMRDVELQQAAATFRVLPTIAASAPPTAVPAAPPTVQPAARPTAAAPPTSKTEPEADGGSNARLVWYGGAALVILLVFFSIIGGKSKGR